MSCRSPCVFTTSLRALAEDSVLERSTAGETSLLYNGISAHAHAILHAGRYDSTLGVEFLNKS